MEDDLPYCIYDTFECEDCGACDPSPLVEWQEFKKGWKKKKR